MFMCIYPLLLGWMMMKTGIKYLKLIAFHTHISAPLSGQVWAIVSPIMTRHQHFSQVNNPAHLSSFFFLVATFLHIKQVQRSVSGST